MLKKFSLAILFCFFIALPAQAQTVKIFITNDVHGHIEHISPSEKHSGTIGYAYLKDYIKTSVADRKILMDAGDTFSGNEYTRADYGKSIAKLMGQMDYQYIIAGNREFDFNSALGKADYYADLLELLRFNQKKYIGRPDNELCISVSQNILKANGTTLKNNYTSPVVIYDESKNGGPRIIVTGITTTATLSQKSIHYMDDITFGDKASILQNLEKSLEQYSNDKDIVIVLSHVGLQDEDKYLSAKELAQVKNVDIISDAHSHKLSSPSKIDNTTYVNGGAFFSHFIEITITEDGNYDVQLIDYEQATKVEPDKDIAQAVEQVTKYGEAQKVIGKLPAVIVLDNKNGAAKQQVTDFGRFICKTIQHTTGADIAIFPGGNILGKSILQNTIHKKDVYSSFMFLRNIVTIKMSAQQIKQLFDNKFSQKDIFTKANYTFPQFYGMDIELSQKADGSYEVFDIKQNDISILTEPDKQYILAVTSDMVYGGYDYTFDKNSIISENYPDIAAVIVRAFNDNALSDSDFTKLQKANLTIKNYNLMLN